MTDQTRERDIFGKSGLTGFPGIRRVTMPLKDLKAMMLQIPLPVLLNGTTWNIRSKRVCPGVYEVWLEAR